MGRWKVARKDYGSTSNYKGLNKTDFQDIIDLELLEDSRLDLTDELIRQRV